MTVAHPTMSTAYHRPEGLDAAIQRLGMLLVAWARHRADRHAIRTAPMPWTRSAERINASRDRLTRDASVIRIGG